MGGECETSSTRGARYTQTVEYYDPMSRAWLKLDHYQLSVHVDGLSACIVTDHDNTINTHQMSDLKYGYNGGVFVAVAGRYEAYVTNGPMRTDPDTSQQAWISVRLPKPFTELTTLMCYGRMVRTTPYRYVD
jgi:hypothetical protein